MQHNYRYGLSKRHGFSLCDMDMMNNARYWDTQPHSQKRDNMLRIEVLDGSNLPAGDKNGLSDPYVEVVAMASPEVKVATFKTRTIKKTLNPEWNQTFETECKSLYSIDFFIWDWDFGSADDKLGQVSVSAEKDKLSRWPQLLTLKLNYGGSLRVKISLSGEPDWVFSRYNGTLSLTFDRAELTRPAQETYCYAQLVGMNKSTTTHKSSSKTPEWGQTLSFDVRAADNSPTQQLQIDLYEKRQSCRILNVKREKDDKDACIEMLHQGMLKDTFLGTTTLPISVLLSHRKKWWDLFANKKSNIAQGRFLLQTDWKGRGGYPKLVSYPKGCTVGIVSAFYGCKSESVDVTSVCRKIVDKNGMFKWAGGAEMRFVFACDPCPLAQKTLNIRYYNHGELKTQDIQEDESENIELFVGDLESWIKEKEEEEKEAFRQRNKQRILDATKQTKKRIEAAAKKAESVEDDLQEEAKKVRKIAELMQKLRVSMSERRRAEGLAAVRRLQTKNEDRSRMNKNFLERSTEIEKRKFKETWKTEYDPSVT